MKKKNEEIDADILLQFFLFIWVGRRNESFGPTVEPTHGCGSPGKVLSDVRCRYLTPRRALLPARPGFARRLRRDACRLINMLAPKDATLIH